MHIIERPIWDEERGLMTIEEHSDYLCEVDIAAEKEREDHLAAEREAGNSFNTSDVETVFRKEFAASCGMPTWGNRRILYALSRSISKYWPSEWVLGPRSFSLPPALRHGRTIPEVLLLLVNYSLRTRNTKAAVRNYLLRSRAFLDREDRHLVRRRLAR